MGYTLYRAPSLQVPGNASGEPTTTALGDWYASRLNIGWHRLVVCVSQHGQIPVVTTARGPAMLPARLASSLERLLRRTGANPSRVAGELAAMQHAAVAVGLTPAMLEATRDHGWAVRDILRVSAEPMTLDDVAWTIIRTRGLDERLAALLGG